MMQQELNNPVWLPGMAFVRVSAWTWVCRCVGNVEGFSQAQINSDVICTITCIYRKFAHLKISVECSRLRLNTDESRVQLKSSQIWRRYHLKSGQNPTYTGVVWAISPAQIVTDKLGLARCWFWDVQAFKCACSINGDAIVPLYWDRTEITYWDQLSDHEIVQLCNYTPFYSYITVIIPGLLSRIVTRR